jgi:predicted ATP-dependent endonuclease of OLD family
MYYEPDDLEYIKKLNTEELIEIVTNIWGFEETSAALSQLKKRDPQKALELGMVILLNDGGDDFLQADVWNYIFNIDPPKVIDALCKRSAPIGNELLNDMLRYINNEYYVKDLNDIPTKLISKIIDAYKSYEEDAPKDLNEYYKDEPEYLKEFYKDEQKRFIENYNELMEKINNLKKL